MAHLPHRPHSTTRVHLWHVYVAVDLHLTLLYKHRLWAGRLIWVLLYVTVWPWACHCSPQGPNFLTLWKIQFDGNPKYQDWWLSNWTNQQRYSPWFNLKSVTGLELQRSPSYLLTCHLHRTVPSWSGIGFVIPVPEWCLQTSPALTLQDF